MTLLRPYLFWFVAIYAIYAAVIIITAPDLSALVRPIYGGFYATQPFTAFWFVFVLFAATVLWRLLMNTPTWAQVAATGIAIASAAIAGPLLARTPLAVGSAVPALAFLAAGFAARRIEPRISQRLRPALGACLLSVAGAVLALRLVSSVDIKQGDWGTPVASIINGVIISWGLVLLARAVNWGSIGRWFTSFAMEGFVIILTHGAVLWATSGLDAFPLWASFVLALVVPAAVGFALRRTPISEWASGAPRVERSTPPAPVVSRDSAPA